MDAEAPGTYVISSNGQVVAVGDYLCQLTGYEKEECIGKDADHLFLVFFKMASEDYRAMLSQQITECYIFTKFHEPLAVKIVLSMEQQQMPCMIAIQEKTESRIHQKLPFVAKLLEENQIGVAVYSHPN